MSYFRGEPLHTYRWQQLQHLKSKATMSQWHRKQQWQVIRPPKDHKNSIELMRSSYEHIMIAFRKEIECRQCLSLSKISISTERGGEITNGGKFPLFGSEQKGKSASGGRFNINFRKKFGPISTIAVEDQFSVCFQWSDFQLSAKSKLCLLWFCFS